jgi:hypothetical protein
VLLPEYHHQSLQPDYEFHQQSPSRTDIASFISNKSTQSKNKTTTSTQEQITNSQQTNKQITILVLEF